MRDAVHAEIIPAQGAYSQLDKPQFILGWGGTETWREVVTCPMSHRGPCVRSSPNPGVTVASCKAC